MVTAKAILSAIRSENLEAVSVIGDQPEIVLAINGIVVHHILCSRSGCPIVSMSEQNSIVIAPSPGLVGEMTVPCETEGDAMKIHDALTNCINSAWPYLFGI